MFRDYYIYFKKPFVWRHLSIRPLYSIHVLGDYTPDNLKRHQQLLYRRF